MKLILFQKIQFLILTHTPDYFDSLFSVLKPLLESQALFHFYIILESRAKKSSSLISCYLLLS